MKLEEYLKSHMLNFERYEIIGTFETKTSCAIAMASKIEPKHYCLQHAGYGRYFNSIDDLNDYAQNRWKKKIVEE